MNVIDVLKLVDSSVAVVAVLFVGYQVKSTLDKLLSNQQDIILKLIEMCGDDDDRKAP
jgi:hypothetical protein